MTDPRDLNQTGGGVEHQEQPDGVAHQHENAVERHCDVAIIGGSAAGLAAALQLSRQRRSTIVIDAGEPRNAPAAHMHSYLGREGARPADFVAVGRAEVRSYGTEILDGRVTDVSRNTNRSFRVTLTGGHVIVARRLLAATGIVDKLPPDIEGLADHWGVGVLHCPFCHGHEVRDQRVVQILTDPVGLHPAKLFRQLTDRFTLVLHHDVAATPADVDELRRAGVTVIETAAQRVVADDTGRLTAVELTDGRRLDADAVVITTRFSPRTEAFSSLDLTLTAHPSGLGDVVQVDVAGQTSEPGLYAAGNIVDPVHQVLQAAADGARVAGAIAMDLATADLSATRREAPNQADWEHRYAGDAVWSGNPNGTLVVELSSTPTPPSATTRRALDIGAGEGADAMWLAEHGWHVTAADVANNAVARIERAAAEHSLPVRAIHADVNDLDPFGTDTYDLVTAFYASIPRTADNRGIANIVDAVAPGGTLLVVDHDPAQLHAHDHADASRAFDPAAYVSIDDIVAVMTESGGWDIDTHETRPRPAGPARHHHVNDIVLRARRHAPAPPGEQ